MARSSSKFWMNPVHTIMTPQMNINDPRYTDGLLKRFRTMLLGTSLLLLVLFYWWK
jgi:hypothetical protein